MKTEFHRITRLPSYVFAEVNKLKARYRDQGHDIIDFGMGNPDIDTESRTKLLATIGYFVIPNDVMNEEILGPIGYSRSNWDIVERKSK